MFSVVPGSQARSFLKKQDKALQKRIIDGIRKLSGDPKPRGAIKLIGEENTYRIRIGGYRVLYEVYYDQKIVLIVKIDKRSRVYD